MSSHMLNIHVYLLVATSSWRTELILARVKGFSWYPLRPAAMNSWTSKSIEREVSPTIILETPIFLSSFVAYHKTQKRNKEIKTRTKKLKTKKEKKGVLPLAVQNDLLHFQKVYFGVLLFIFKVKSVFFFFGVPVTKGKQEKKK